MRVTTFNLENLTTNEDFEKRKAILLPQLKRLNADIILFQEIHSQKGINDENDLLALKNLLKETKYKNYNIASTLSDKNQPYALRNLVIVSRFPIIERNQYMHVF